MYGGEQHSHVNRLALWVGLLGGAAAWTAHLMLAYAVAEFGCLSPLDSKIYLGITVVAWLEFSLTAVCTLAALGATALAYVLYRRLRAKVGPDDPAGAAERDTAWTGLLTSGTFTLVIVFESIPILYYLQCC